MTDPPRWAAGLVRLREGESGLDDALDAALEQLSGRRPDLALVFCAGVDAAHEAPLLARVRERLAARVLCGCSARSVLGRGEELEGEGGLSFLTGSMPGTELRAL